MNQSVNTQGGVDTPVERSMTAVKLGKRLSRPSALCEEGALRSAMSHSCRPSSSRFNSSACTHKEATSSGQEYSSVGQRHSPCQNKHL